MHINNDVVHLEFDFTNCNGLTATDIVGRDTTKCYRRWSHVLIIWQIFIFIIWHDRFANLELHCQRASFSGSVYDLIGIYYN